MADFNIADLFNRNMLGNTGGKGAGGGSDGTNEKSTIDGALDASGKATYTAAKLVGLPINLSDLGSVSLTKPFDSEGITGKTIMPSMLHDAQGGFLARLLHDIFIKNKEITDHTSGTGGGGSGGGDFASSGGGGGGDFGGGGGGFESFNTSGANFSSMASHSNDFDWSPVPMASLGSLPRPITPDVGSSAGVSMDM